MFDEKEESVFANPDSLQEEKTLGNEFPTAEESMTRLALERTLSNKQKKVWEYWNFDKLTQVEIAKKLRVTPSAIGQQIKTIEKQVEKYIQSHQQLYNLLKMAEASRKQF